MNIALANELAQMAHSLNINAWEVIRFANLHPRVNVHQPGPGVGGHCIAVDPWFFVESSPDKTQLIATSRRVNDKMPGYTAEKIMREVSQLGLERPRICCVGLAYKPDVADMRESPALRVVEVLVNHGFEVITYDPLVEEFQGKTLHGNVVGQRQVAGPHGARDHGPRREVPSAVRRLSRRGDAGQG